MEWMRSATYCAAAFPCRTCNSVSSIMILVGAVAGAVDPPLIAGAVPTVEPMFVAHNAQFDKRQVEAAIEGTLRVRVLY